MSSSADAAPVLDTDIAVVGMAGRFAGARSVDEYWQVLRQGVEALSRFSEAELAAAGVDAAALADPNYVRVGAVLPDMEDFDARFFGFSPREASIMDPQHRHFLEVAWSALENAGHVPASFPGAIGVFAGSGHNAYMPYNLLTNPKLMQSVGLFLVRHTGNDKDFLTTRVSYLLNLRGPSVNVQTACSTSLVAIHMAVQSLLNGECDMALAGGVTIELPHRHGYLYRENEILSPDGHCRAFDAASQGTVFGSGVGVVVLRRLADAIADGDHIHAVIKGSAVNNDGSQKVGYMAPSVDGQAQAVAEALAVANVSADTITYVAAHGTGTPVGDPIEVAALTQAFRQSTVKTRDNKRPWCALGSVKPNIGHTDTAAGVASFIAVAKAMQAREIPPLLHFQRGNPACDFERTPFYVNAERIDWQPPAGMPRRAGVSSLGVGGTNAHVVMEEAPPRVPSSAPARRWQVLVQSARSMASLDAASLALAQHFESQPQTSLADAAYTLQVGRQPMPLRRVVVADSAAAAAAALRDVAHATTEQAADGARSVAFMFAGGGAQHPGMGADLYASEPVYRAAVDECLAILQSRLNLDLKPLLYPPAGAEDAAAEQLQRPSLALPALFTAQLAQARLWQSWGIEPTAMIGHSMGEYTAAHLAGVFTLADALTLVELRGRLFETLPEGAMLSVPLPEAELRPLLPRDVAIGVINGPQLCVASGPVASIEALQRRLAEMEIDAARVRIQVAAHSPMLEPILAKFGAFLRGITMRAPALPFVSNLSGAMITAAEATSPDYWVRHLRHTVRFADGIQALLADESRVLLEVGPGRTLTGLARSHPARKPAQAVVTSMRHADDQADDQAVMLGALGRLWACGIDVDWARLRGEGERRLRIELPTYCFERQRHWIEPGKSGVLSPEDRPLHKRKDLAQWFYQPVWQRTPSAAAPVAPHTGTTPRRTLLLSDGSAFADALARRLREAGDEVTVAAAGRVWRVVDPRHFTLDPRRGDDIERLFQAVLAVNPPPSRIVHLWNLPDHDLETTLQRGFYRLLQMAQIIGREDLSHPMALMVLTRHAQRVAGESDLDAAKATLLGPCKVIPREFANVRCALVDIDAPAAGSRLEQRLLDGLAADLDAAQAGTLAHDVLAWRAGERWVLTHGETPLPPATASVLRPQGVYVITGGLGGVGLALAEHLARRVQARLVLIGRQGLPERSRWSEHLAASDGHDAAARRIRQVMAIEALGSEVLVIAADVTNVAQMKSALRQARARFGALHGVLHTAGVLADGVIQLKETAVAASVLAPKVQGTLALEAALADDPKAPPLDFLLLFSSISAFAGLAGQIDYAAANAFLDAHAQSRWARGHANTVAIDWSQWQEVGMAAELASQLGLAADALAGEEGTALERALAQRLLLDTHEERVVQTRLSRATHWLLEEHQVKGGEALIPGTGYLEIVRQAFALQPAEPGAQAIELRNVTFLAPFVVRAGQERDLRVHLRGLNTPAASFSIVGRAAGAAHAHEAWTEHVRGQVARTDTPAAEHEPTADVAARCTLRTQEGQRAPEHLLFGPRWSNIRRIDFGRDEALLSLELPLAYAPDLAEFALHPALMDMATGGAQEIVPGLDPARDLFVPAMYGRVRVHGPLTALLTSHVRRRVDASNDEHTTPDIVRFDITIRDATGRVVVEIEDFTMIRVRDKALLARSAAAAPAPSNKPRATANNVLALGLRDGIASAEGAEAIERILAAPPGPQVVVSPQDLLALLARLRQTATPAAAADVAETSADYRAPTTALEKTIAQMWSEMLGHARVGADDDFFDLGGHSLLAVQVINKLRKATGKALPLTALLEAPTVRALAALIEPDGGQPAPGADSAAAKSAATPMVRSATLIPVRPASGKPPLFFVHDGLGETLLYRNLALRLEPGHPVYGIQPETNARGEYAQTTIRDWAAAHIRTLRRVQPHGPYHIAGLCAGGVIAVEMARQLQEAGEQTAYVGILDAADTELPEIAGRIRKERLQRVARLFAAQGGAVTPWSVLRALPTLALKALRAARYELGTRWARALDARKVRRLRAQSGTPASTLPDDSRIAYLPLYEHAHREHKPGPMRLHGFFALYRATKGDGTPADQPYIERYGDPLLGWGPRVAQPLEVVDVPGGHASLLQEPHVQRLAEAMNAHLARVARTAAAAQTAHPAEGVGAPRPAAAAPAPQPADVEA